MSDDLATNPTPTPTEGAATEVANTPSNEPEVSNDDLDTDDQVQAVEETEEVDWEDGKKYTVPKALKDALLRQADYTRKTQEVAEGRKALEAHQAQLRQQAEWQQANIREFAKLENINDQLAQFNNIDWQRLDQEDPVRAQALHRQWSMLKEAGRDLGQQLSYKQAQALEAQRSESAKRLQEGRAALAKAIPNFTPELAKSLRDHGTSYGFSAEEIGQIDDPRHVQVLHDAYLWREFQKKQRATATQKPVQQAEPVPQVQGRKPTQPGLRDDLSTEEWVKRREAQLKRKP